jgi:hypothetical protein
VTPLRVAVSERECVHCERRHNDADQKGSCAHTSIPRVALATDSHEPGYIPRRSVRAGGRVLVGFADVGVIEQAGLRQDGDFHKLDQDLGTYVCTRPLRKE